MSVLIENCQEESRDLGERQFSSIHVLACTHVGTRVSAHKYLHALKTTLGISSMLQPFDEFVFITILIQQDSK